MKMQPPAAENRTVRSSRLVPGQGGSPFYKKTALQNAIEGSADFAVIATDENGLIQVFNAGAERLLGYKAAEAIGKLRPSDFNDPLEASAHAKLLSAELGVKISSGFEALTSKALRGIEDKYELSYVRKNGSRIPALVSITCLRDDAGSNIGYLIVGTDISIPKRAAEAAAVKLLNREVEHRRRDLERTAQERLLALRDSEELFRQIATNIPEALWIRDADTKTLRYINPAWEKLTGRRANVGDRMEKLFEAFHPDDMQEVINASRDYPNGGAHLECRIKLPNGDSRWISARTFPIADSEGTIYRIAGLMDDITDRKVESQRVERLKDEFVSTVSHELRTPLTSIAGSLGLLVGNAGGKLPESAVRLLMIAHTNSQRLVRLINDILDIEKIESGKVIYELERIDIRSAVDQSIEAMRGFAEGYDVHIRVDDLSATGDVCADRDRLIQVFTNLLSNAIKFSPKGESVLVTIERLPGALRISVEDHGRGIPEDFKSHVFEKFAQADSTDARRLGGTGLGLSIVHQIVKRLGGEVAFDDALGGGAVFHVTLPDWDVSNRARGTLDLRSHGTRILLCEDDPDAANTLRERFWQAGLATDIAYTADEAIDLAATTNYSAILVDLQLPDGDGIGLIKRLKAQPNFFNTLLVVASSDAKSLADAAASSRVLNILDWLDMPVDTDRLSRVFDRLVGSDVSARPRVLHIEDDADVIQTVARAFSSRADVVSVESINAARAALSANRFDVAVLNIALSEGSGIDLLLDLSNADGDAIPVIVFSAPNANDQFSSRIQAALTNPRASIDSLVAILRKHLVDRPMRNTQ